ncbi:unnamed protein product [Trichobilharzia szidati]|nr:unnamed protein product [Trichobilharzia szidati]
MLTCYFYVKLLIISSISLSCTKCLPILLYNKLLIPVDLGGFADAAYPLWGFSTFSILTYYKPLNYDNKKHVYPHYYSNNNNYYYAPKSKTHDKQKLLVQSSLSSAAQPPSSPSFTYKNNAPYKKQYVPSSQHQKTSLDYYNNNKKAKGKESVEKSNITPVNYYNKYHHGYNHQKYRWTPIIYHDQKRKNQLNHPYLGIVKRLNYRHERSAYNYPTQKHINKRYDDVNNKISYNVARHKLKNSQHDKYNNGKLKYVEAKFGDSTVAGRDTYDVERYQPKDSEYDKRNDEGIKYDRAKYGNTLDRKDTYDVERYQSKDLEYDKRNDEGINYDRAKSDDTLDRKDIYDVERYQSKDSEYDKRNEEGIKYDRAKLINTQDEKRTYGVTRHKPKDLQYKRYSDEEIEYNKAKFDSKYAKEYRSKGYDSHQREDTHKAHLLTPKISQISYSNEKSSPRDKNVKSNKHQSDNHKLSTDKDKYVTDYERIGHRASRDIYEKPLPAYGKPKYALIYDEIKNGRGSHVELRKKLKKLEKEEGLHQMMKKPTYDQKSPNKKSNTNDKKKGKSKSKDNKNDKKDQRAKDRDSILMIVNEYS